MRENIHVADTAPRAVFVPRRSWGWSCSPARAAAPCALHSHSFLLCSVTALTIPTRVSPQPPGSDSRERETIAREATRQKIVSVLIRPHEGVPADTPYSIAPRQTVSFCIFLVLRLSRFSAGDA